MKMKHTLRRYGLAAMLLLGVIPVFAQGVPTVPPTSSPYVDANGYPVYPISKSNADAQKRALIDRGEYLAKAGDCIACHSDSKRGGAPYAGGLGIKTPFGTFYSPNITGDKETGIGNWTDEQFIRAMREGIGPDGSNYFPVFPYMYFDKLNSDDLLAIKAYLNSIPSVYRPNTPHDVPWPFNVRFAQWGWKFLFFEWHKGLYEYDATKSEQWNRGAYLVQGLGHCAMCHSPLNPLGAVKRGYELTGGFVDGYYAPDITSRGLNDATVDDIVKVFIDNEMLHGAGKVQGPMAEVNYDSLRHLSMDDLRAIAVYLKSYQSKAPVKVAAVAKIGPDTGRDIYESHCEVCHGSGAAGAPKLGDAKAWEPRLAQGMETVFSRAINGYNSMPPKGACMSCSDDEIKAAAQYLADQSKPGAGFASAPKSYIPTQPPLTLEEGKQVYEDHCSICHATGKFNASKVGDKTVWAPLIKQNMDILFRNALHGHIQAPGGNNCSTCSDAEVIAATKYMAQQSRNNGDYSLW
jgi:cytochrome c5